RLQALPRPMRLGRLARERFAARVGVEKLALRCGSQQRLVRVLAVDIEKPLPDLAQLGGGRGMAVDEAAGTPRAIDDAAQDELAGIALQIVLFEPGSDRAFCLELRGNFGSLRSL